MNPEIDSEAQPLASRPLVDFSEWAKAVKNSASCEIVLSIAQDGNAPSVRCEIQGRLEDNTDEDIISRYIVPALMCIRAGHESLNEKK